MKKYWQIFWVFSRYRLMSVLEYRGLFVFWVIVDVMWTGFNVLFFALLVQSAGGISGWSPPELLLLLGFLLGMRLSLGHFFTIICVTTLRAFFDGDLNLLLTKPLIPSFT